MKLKGIFLLSFLFVACTNVEKSEECSEYAKEEYKHFSLMGRYIDSSKKFSKTRKQEDYDERMNVLEELYPLNTHLLEKHSSKLEKKGQLKTYKNYQKSLEETFKNKEELKILIN